MNEKDIIQPAPVDAENATTPTPDTPAAPAAETTTPAPALPSAAAHANRTQTKGGPTNR